MGSGQIWAERVSDFRYKRGSDKSCWRHLGCVRRFTAGDSGVNIDCTDGEGIERWIPIPADEWFKASWINDEGIQQHFLREPEKRLPK